MRQGMLQSGFTYKVVDGRCKDWMPLCGTRTTSDQRALREPDSEQRTVRAEELEEHPQSIGKAFTPTSPISSHRRWGRADGEGEQDERGYSNIA